MSAGPISQERAGRRVAPPAKITLKVGDIVTFDPHPHGQPRWSIVAIPSHPVGSDVATLELAKPGYFEKRQTRRFVRDLRLVSDPA